MSVVSRVTMLRIDGNASNDGVLASQFALAALSETEDRVNRISRVFNMEEILCEESLRMIQSAIAGLRHINLTVTEIATFHSNGSLSTAMGNLQSKIESHLNTAEEQYKVLAGLYP